jgi:16S rRNA (cytosine1402-N4)-methyltransferase
MNVMRTQNNHSKSFSGSGPQQETVHIPVLLQEVLENIHIESTDTVLDGTLGGGGHALAMAQQLGAEGVLVGIDTDSVAIERAQRALAEVKCTTHLVQDNFRNLDTVLDALGITGVHIALFDLGLSSDQLEVSGRGFTFQHNEPLTMTLSDIVGEDTLTAKEIVNEWAEESLADIIYGYGGERYARRIAKGIVLARTEAVIETTEQLVEIIQSSVPGHYRHGKTHPATKTFQALRITVNDELGAAKEALTKVYNYLAPQGRVAVITFHSLEDRLVKRLFREWEDEGLGTRLTKRPIPPSDTEMKENRRARSAKLRVFQKV